MYGEDDIITTYREVCDLLITRQVIKSYSSNKNDIRDVALEGLDLHSMKRVLELGCGYGFFVEKLQNRIHEEAVIIGIDMVENNREPFIHSVASIGYRGEFIAGNASIITQMNPSSFDVIIASYSLYFFPSLIPAISRVLRPDGVFIAVTHSKHTLRELTAFVVQCLDAVGVERPDEITFNKLFESFSSEEGGNALREYFSSVERIIYQNRLIFSRQNIDDCLFYIQKKRRLIYKEALERLPDRIDDIERCVETAILREADTHGSIEFNKDDAVFRCRGPIH